MKNILIVQGHPDPAGDHLCHALAEAYEVAASDSGHSVTTIDIAHEEIPFIRSRADWESETLPDVARVGQEAVAKADHIVIIYPLWMGDVPALLKAWIEQVLRQGFAFEMHGTGWTPALKGKSARVVVTMGMPRFAYNWFFFAHSLRSLTRNILKFCGIRPVGWTVIGNAEDPSGRAQANALQALARLGARGA